MITIDERQVKWQSGMTLEQLLVGLKGSQHIAVVRLNGKLVSLPHFGQILVPDGAVVEVIPHIAGG